MEMKMVTTSVGPIAVHIKPGVKDQVPIIFLHGVYFDHHLWDQFTTQMTRTIIAVDMPLHGASRQNIKPNWTIDDCATMLIDILRELKIEKVIAVGHSWGSMTIVRAAHLKPEAFHSLGLCNLRFREETIIGTWLIYLRHTVLPFKTFYLNQVSQALYAKQSLKNTPDLSDKLINSMQKLTRRDIMHIDHTVIINPKDSSELIANIPVKAVAVIGEHDYVGTPPIKDLTVVPGGHVSPLEAPDHVMAMLKKII